MPILTMKSFVDGQPRVQVDVGEIDEHTKFGGFGMVCSIEGRSGFIAKRLDLRTPVTPGHARKYLQHVRLAKEKLGRARSQLEELSEEARIRIRDFLDEILNHSLSTHWCYEYDENDLVRAVWFLLPKALGKDLNEHFKDDGAKPPSLTSRSKIATDFATRMRTLRRPGFIHLDCTVDNIRLDKDKMRLVMIDLDGCGIEVQSTARINLKAQKDDEWEVFPTTLGKQERFVRVPPWYPQEGLTCGPSRGNYKFAERWVALDTIIRILSWGKIDALSWLPADVRRSLSASYGNVRKAMEPYLTLDSDSEKANEAWESISQQELAAVRAAHYPLTLYLPGTWTSQGQPECLTYFSNLTQEAYFDPRSLRGEPDERGYRKSMYDVFLKELRLRGQA